MIVKPNNHYVPAFALLINEYCTEVFLILTEANQ